MSGNHPGSRSYRFWQIEGDVVDPAAQLGVMDPAHLAEQPQHLLVLGQHDEREGLDAMRASDSREDCQQRPSEPAVLIFVHYRDGYLSHVGADHAVVPRHTQTAL